jgi:NitT/TauT family transport system substrate-binding protein
MEYKAFLRAIRIVVLSIGVGACGSEPRYPLRIGINPWPGYEFLFLAEAQGLFERHGADIELVEFASLGDVRRSFERGQVDGMASTLIEVLQARYQSQREPQIVMVADYSNGADVILARAPIDSIAALRGKRVAAESASLGFFMLHRALELEGMSPKDVSVVAMDQTELCDALRNERVEAVVTYPPSSIEIERDLRVNELFSSADIPGEVVDVITIDKSVLDQRSDDARRLILAWDDALRFAKRHPAEAYRIMASRQGIEPEEFRAALAGIQVLTSAEQKPLFESDQGLRRTIGMLDKAMRAAGLVDGPDRSTGSIAVAPMFAPVQ